MKTSIPRLASVQLKKPDTAKLHIFYNRSADDVRRRFDRQTAEVVVHHQGNMAGFAIVAWGADGASTTAMCVGKTGSVGVRMVPDFVRSALIDHVAGMQ